MSDIIPINLAVEDPLSETVLRKILLQSDRNYWIGSCFCRGGFGYLKKRIGGFNNAAKGTAFLILTDLDDSECAPEKIKEWISEPINRNLLFRIAVREVESWVIAHRSAFAEFLGISKNILPKEPDTLVNAKDSLLRFVLRSRKRGLKDALIPSRGSTARVGPDYNATLGFFIQKQWDVYEASKTSPSLNRTLHSILNFHPKFK